jgi:cytochrome P450
MFDYLLDLLKRKSVNPDDSDLVGRLVIERIQPGDLSMEEAAFMLSHLYLAGHETTANQIGLGVLSLLQDPVQRQALHDNPELARDAIEELLRLHSIVHFNSARVATQDVEVGGQMIRAGEGVYALIAAANRDPEIFDDPDAMRIDRDARHHVAFSFGVHQCLGQPLARLELEVVFAKLFRRLPGLKLAVPFEELAFKNQGLVYGLHHLPVTW